MLSEYNKFVKKHKKPGMTMSDVARMWRKKKGSKSSSKKRKSKTKTKKSGTKRRVSSKRKTRK